MKNFYNIFIKYYSDTMKTLIRSFNTFLLLGIGFLAYAQPVNDMGLASNDINPKIPSFPSTHTIQFSFFVQNDYTTPSVALGGGIVGEIGITVSLSELEGSNLVLSGSLATKLNWTYVNNSGVRSIIGRWKALEAFDDLEVYDLQISGLRSIEFVSSVAQNMGFNVNLVPPINVTDNDGDNNDAASFTWHSINCNPFRSIVDGNWNLNTNWQTYGGINNADVEVWNSAVSTPVSGNTVLIRNNIVQNVDFTINNCPLILDENSSTSKLTIAPLRTLSFGGGLDGNAYFNNRPVVVQSTTDGAGAINTMLADSKTFGDENVTVERFLPGPTDPNNPGGRRWNLLALGVTNGSTLNTNATIRDAWGGGGRTRVGNSQNAFNNLPLGNPVGGKPNNTPYDAGTSGLPADYVSGDGTIITGHRYDNAAAANAAGFDWWPELIIPQGEGYWIFDPSKPPGQQYRLATAQTTITTPSSIRPYRPGADRDGFSAKRGTDWVSNPDINGNGNPANSVVNTTLANADQGYMLYTRGDRSVLENWAGSTTLRPTGKIRSFDVEVPISAKGVQPLTVVGNPYPAPIDFQKVLDLPANASLIEPRFHFWDSKLPGQFNAGAWRTAFKIGSDWYTTLPAGNVLTPNAQVISSSQAVMVEAIDAAGDLAFDESMKAPAANATVVPFSDPVENNTTNKAGLLFVNMAIVNNNQPPDTQSGKTRGGTTPRTAG